MGGVNPKRVKQRSLSAVDGCGWQRPDWWVEPEWPRALSLPQGAKPISGGAFEGRCADEPRDLIITYHDSRWRIQRCWVDELPRRPSDSVCGLGSVSSPALIQPWAWPWGIRALAGLAWPGFAAPTQIPLVVWSLCWGWSLTSLALFSSHLDSVWRVLVDTGASGDGFPVDVGFST